MSQKQWTLFKDSNLCLYLPWSLQAYLNHIQGHCYGLFHDFWVLGLPSHNFSTVWVRETGAAGLRSSVALCTCVCRGQPTDLATNRSVLYITPPEYCRADWGVLPNACVRFTQLACKVTDCVSFSQGFTGQPASLYWWVMRKAVTLNHSCGGANDLPCSASHFLAAWKYRLMQPQILLSASLWLSILCKRIFPHFGYG